jgi:hypothetical protein
MINTKGIWAEFLISVCFLKAQEELIINSLPSCPFLDHCLPGFFLFACFFERARYLASDSMLQLEGYLKIYMRSFEGVLLYQAHPGCILSYLFKRERFIPSFLSICWGQSWVHYTRSSRERLPFFQGILTPFLASLSMRQRSEISPLHDGMSSLMSPLFRSLILLYFPGTSVWLA